MINTTYREAAERFVADIERLSKEPSRIPAPTIGIGITTHTRANGLPVFIKTVTEILKHRPVNSRIVIVDDASELKPVSALAAAGVNSEVEYFMFDENVGIARAKNKCFELLQDCEHIFLFDDDTFPIRPNWYTPYIESKEGHLMYIFTNFSNGTPCGDITTIYEDNKIKAYTHVRGCMLYYKRACLKAVGGMDTIYGKWGNEHGDLSNRIFNAGLTTFRYMDVANSKDLFYSGDEHMNVTSTYGGVRKMDAIDSTQHIYDRQRNTAFYREYREKSPVVLSTYYTGVVDPQRGHKWEFNPRKIEALASSVIDKHVQLVMIRDDEAGLNDRDSQVINYYQAKASLNPYLQRWIHYYQYLREMKNQISWAFLVDATDVEMLNMPKPVPGKIYIGSENDTVACEWLIVNHPDAILKRFYKDYSDFQLLNAGVVGGYVEDLIPFVKSIVDCIFDLLKGQKLHKQHGPGLTDMAILNLVAYTQFQGKIITGLQVTTEFKANAHNNYSWFKHK